MGRIGHEDEEPNGLLLLLAVSLPLRSAWGAPKKFKVAYSCGQELEERWQREIGMFADYFKKAGVDFVSSTAGYDTNKQIAQCENYISQGVDLLIITPTDADATAVIADSAKKAGVPIIVYDQPMNSKNVSYLVTFDAVETGSLIAQYTMRGAPSGNYVILYGDQANMNAQNIKIGDWQVLGDAIKSKKIHVVMEQWVKSWDPNVALSFVENALTANKNDIQAVVAPNDGTAGGVVQALAAQGLAGKVPVAGQDADLAACQRVVEGTQAMTVYKNLIKLNTATCQIAMALLNKKDPQASVDKELGEWTAFKLKSGDDVPMFKPRQIAVTKDNMMKEIVKTGFHKFDDVYRNVPAAERPNS